MALSLCAGVYLEPSHVFKGLIILRFSAQAEHFNLASELKKWYYIEFFSSQTEHFSPGLNYLDCSQQQFQKQRYRRVLEKKGAINNFAKFTWKHLCQSLFLDKVADLLKI